MAHDLVAPEDDLLKAGPPIVGIVINWFLWGILVMQYFIYINGPRFKNDSKYLRVIVYFLFLLDSAQSILTMADIFRWYVYNLGSDSVFLFFEFTGIDLAIFDCTIQFLVQLVYCWRIWVLSRWIVLPSLIAFLSLASGASGWVIGVYAQIIKDSSRIQFGFRCAMMLWYGAGIATDILIACTMTFLLLRLRSQNLSRNLVITLKRITTLILEANILTTIIVISTSVGFAVPSLAPPYTTIYYTGAYVIGKLYSNCFMVLLNQRVYYSDSLENTQNTVVSGLVFNTSHEPESTVAS